MCRALTPRISQDVLVAQPTQLNATEQDTLVKQIGLSLLRAAPRDWRRVSAEYRAVGRYHELSGEVVTAEGITQEWVATHDIATLFGRLRAGMYREGRGTWFNARYQLDHPSSYNLEYDREEPRWDLMPPPQAYADELRMFPRSEENVPDWLMRRMSGLGPERPGPRFRMARIFDGAGPNGRPVVHRPELDSEELDHLLDYLDGAPVVLPGRGYDLDRLASNPDSTVPIAFHSDGVWIWPAAVNYYLREYGVAPEGDLMQHIRAAGFAVPEVPDQVRQAAAAHVTRGGPPQPRHAPPQPEPPAPAPTPAGHDDEPPFEEEFGETDAEMTRISAPVRHEEPPPEPEPEPGRAEQDGFGDTGPVGQATTFTPMPDLEGGPPTTITSPAPPPVTQHAVTEPQEGEEQPTGPPVPLPLVEDHEPENVHRDEPDDGGPPTQFAAAPVPRYDEPALSDLEDKLDELGIPASSYRIGDAADYGWSLEEVPEGWRVGWYEGELTSTAVFGDAEDAAAFMLGKVLLLPTGSPVREPEQQVPPPEPELPPVPVAPSAPSQPVTATLSPEVATGMRPPAPPAPPAPSREREEPAAAARAAGLPRRDVQPAPPRRTEGARPAQEQRQGAQGGQQWPIQPMQGEPPLTLFRGKELRELPAGSELDRFGGPNGNLTYAAGTPFEERSLVPEWVSRPYHVYRVRRPLEALAGVAIPWFNQPGGGAAYLLPASIDDLVAEGDLIELDPGEPPID